jgi:sugar phosphate isomerase/epimerase
MLTYCTNIHPAETWIDTFANIRSYVPEVKKKIAPDVPFPIGLRLSGRAAAELDTAGAERFQDWCQDNDCYVATINGFPYGTFHHVPVKEKVYLPDWRHPERLRYTKELARILTFMLPENMRGSISSVPVGFKDCIGPDAAATVRKHLLDALEFLDHTAQTTGKEILLALEPEPACVLETTTDVVRYFASLDLPQTLRPFLAVCYDCCHQALQFESPLHSLELLAANDIRIGHVQVSSALRLEHSDLRSMHRFCEPCYLHQTVGRRRDGTLLRFNDLDLALSSAVADVDEWRIHFHIPVFVDLLSDGASTQPYLKEILPLFDTDIPLEVETYTWTVLPPDLQTATVTDSIIREIDWVQEHRTRSPAKIQHNYPDCHPLP